MRRFIVVLLSTVFLTACGGSDNSEPPAELIEFKETLTVKELWSVDTGNGVEQLFVKLFPLVLNDSIVVTDRDGTVTSYNLKTGKQLW